MTAAVTARYRWKPGIAQTAFGRTAWSGRERLRSTAIGFGTSVLSGIAVVTLAPALSGVPIADLALPLLFAYTAGAFAIMAWVWPHRAISVRRIDAEIAESGEISLSAGPTGLKIASDLGTETLPWRAVVAVQHAAGVLTITLAGLRVLPVPDEAWTEGVDPGTAISRITTWHGNAEGAP